MLMISIGVLGAVVTGLTSPANTYIFGDLADVSFSQTFPHTTRSRVHFLMTDCIVVYDSLWCCTYYWR